MTHLQRMHWREITDKHSRRRDELDSKQSAARGKTSRYPSAAGHNHERDIDEH
jgi:hypothetical protein